MANYETLKSAIQQVVKTNGRKEITGELLQQSLLAMINSLGQNYQYAGIATPSTDPGTPDQNIFYLASTAGTYTNFGGLVVNDGEIAILKYNGTWTKELTGAATAQEFGQLANKVNFLLQYYQFAGVATPSTDPGTPDQNVFYIAGPGTYQHFDAAVIPDGYIGVLKYNENWTVDTIKAGDVNAVKFVAQTLTNDQKDQARTNIEAASNEQVAQLGAKVGVFNVSEIAEPGVSPYTVFASAAAARASVPDWVKKNGRIISYLLEDGWHLEMFVQNASNPVQSWNNANDDSFYPIPLEPFKKQNILFNVNAYLNEGTNVTYTLAQAIAAVPPAYRNVARAIIFRAMDGVQLALFDSNSFFSGWTTESNWIVFNKTTLTNLATAISNISTISGNIGNLAGLNTTTKTSIVAAINELVIAISSLENGLTELFGELVGIRKDNFGVGSAATPTTLSASSRLNTDGSISSVTSSYEVAVFDVTGKDVVFVSGRSTTSNPVAVALDSSSNVLKYWLANSNTDYTDYAIALPTGTTVLKVQGYANKRAGMKPLGSLSDLVTTNKTSLVAAINEVAGGGGNANYWMNKKLWWCGTSIPAGSDETLGLNQGAAGDYPSKCGVILGATVYNRAIGGSMCRANVRTGDYNGANYQNITSSLSMTNAEAEDFITNYATYKALSWNASWPDSMTDQYKTRIRAGSFESRLIPYLDGTYPMPDLFVIDHGHNDFKYTLADNSTDINLEPTRANITAGILAEDTYMTANNNEKLVSFFGSLDNIDPTKLDAFVCSLNRNCYIGAVNFIVTLILKYNPRARFLFVSNYEKANGDYPTYAPLITAQETLATSWAFPLCKVFERLGFSNHIIPGTKNFYAGQSTPYTFEYDIDAFKINCPDKVHPASDLSGHSTDVYAGILAEFIKTCR